MKRIAFITFISSILIFPFQIKAQAVENVFLKANEGHTDIINDFILSANNKYLVSCGEDKTIILWDFDTAKEIKRINGHKNNISCIDINFDNTQIATGEGGKEIDTKYVVKIWDIKTSKELRTIKPNAGKILSVKFLNKGKSLLVAGSSRIIYYDLETSSKARDFLDIKEELLNVSISKDQRIISAQSKNKIYIWDIEQRELVKIIEPNSGEFTSIFLDSNGNNAITGSNNNTLTIFNTLSGKEHKNIVAFRYPILTVAADDKNQFIVASDSKSKFFKIFDYNTGDEIRSIEAHAGRVGLIKISLSNQFIITAGSWDRTIKLWDINTGEFVKEFRGIKKSIYEHAYMYSSNYCAIGKIRNRAFINYMSKQNKNQVFKDKYGEVSCITLRNNY